jgi:hypothetical protein
MRVANTSEWRATNLRTSLLQLQLSQRYATQMSLKEADVHLAVSSIENSQIESIYRAVAVYNIPETTLRHQRAGMAARRDCPPNSKKLTQREEEVLVQYILDLDHRGFAPTYAAVRDMADRLLAARGAGDVGVHWARNFVKRTDSLKTRFNRTYDRQRALCEGPVLIRS